MEYPLQLYVGGGGDAWALRSLLHRLRGLPLLLLSGSLAQGNYCNARGSKSMADAEKKKRHQQWHS